MAGQGKARMVNAGLHEAQFSRDLTARVAAKATETPHRSEGLDYRGSMTGPIQELWDPNQLNRHDLHKEGRE